MSAPDRTETTDLPPYVIQGERDWRPADEAHKGPLSHPCGFDAYSVVEPGPERRTRIYPTKEAAVPYMEEVRICVLI